MGDGEVQGGLRSGVEAQDSGLRGFGLSQAVSVTFGARFLANGMRAYVTMTVTRIEYDRQISYMIQRTRAR